jgi:hypothetical protein
MARLAILVASAVVVLALAACDSSSDDSLPASESADVRVLHAVPDAPAVNVRVDGGEAFSRLDYSEVGGFAAVPTGAREVRVEGVLPGGETATVIGPIDLELEAEREYTVIAAGELADIEPLVISAERFSEAEGAARVQVVHAAPNAPRVDVFVTAADADLASEAPVGTLSFRESFGPTDLPAGEYQIRITPEGDSGSLVFDSGPIEVAGGGDLLLAAVENTGPGDAPIYLMALLRDDAIRIHDRATPATLRAVHAVADAPEVQIIVNDNFAEPVVPGLGFPSFTDYLTVPPATYNVKVTPADNAGAIVLDADVELAPGAAYTLLALGELGAIEPLLLTDDSRSVATAAKVRIVHASPTAGRVDVYVTAPGAAIADLEPAVADLAFTEEAGYLQLAEGSYEVTVTPAGSKDAAIGPVAIELAAGSVYTAAARDETGGGAPLGLILLDGFDQ